MLASRTRRLISPVHAYTLPVVRELPAPPVAMYRVSAW
jgi:hypothetical protein